MGLRALLMTMTIFAVVVSPALAKVYMVGDADGWRLNYNYTKWAEGKDFRVGDSITFIYNPANHNVLKVANGPDFQRCSSSNTSEVPQTTGHDSFTLSTAGKKWYICDIADHCDQGMKLVLTVSASDTLTPAPSPQPGNSAASELSVAKHCAWMFVWIAAYRMIMT